MKTPQEEAESLARQCGFSHASGYDSVQATAMRNIPLAELIAVARAANKVVQNADGEVIIDTYFNADGAGLLAALQSLRATGKVTL